MVSDNKSNETIHGDIGGGETLTVKATNDPDVEGGWFQTTKNEQGEKSTAVYDANGDMPAGKGDNDSYE